MGTSNRIYHSRWKKTVQNVRVIYSLSRIMQRDDLTAWLNFLTAETNVLVDHPELLLQQAVNQPVKAAPPTVAGEQWVAAGRERRPWLRRVDNSAQSSPRLFTISAHSTWISGLLFSRDRRLIASAAIDGTVRLWDSAGGRKLADLVGHQGSVQALALSPSSGLLASASADGTVRLWDTAAGVAFAILDAKLGEVQSCDFSSDGRQIVSSHAAGRLLIWDVEKGAVLRSIATDKFGGAACAFSPDGARVACAGEPGLFQYVLRVWNAHTGECVYALGHGGPVVDCTFLSGGSRLLSASLDGRMREWLIETGQEGLRYIRYRGYIGHRGAVNCCAAFPDGLRVLSGSEDGTLRIWDRQTGEMLHTLRLHGAQVTACSISADATRLVSGDSVGQIIVWDASRIGKGDVAVDDDVLAVAVSRDGAHLATGSSQGQLSMWDSGSGAIRTTMAAHEGPIRALAFSPDGDNVVTASSDKTLKVWHLGDYRLLATLRGHDAPLSDCAVSPAGRIIASTDSSGTLRFWDGDKFETLGIFSAETRARAAPRISVVVTDQGFEASEVGEEGGGIFPPKNLSSPTDCVLSPTGRRLVTVSAEITLWDTIRRRKIAKLVDTWPRKYRSDPSEGIKAGDGGEWWLAAFSPNGEWIITSNYSREACVWNAEKGRQVEKLPPHHGMVHVCLFSPAGDRIATGGAEGTLRLFDAETRELLLTLTDHSGAVIAAAFSPDGRLLASAAAHGEIIVRTADNGEAVCKYPTRGRAVRTVLWHPLGRELLVVDYEGDLHILRLENIGVGPTVVTARVRRQKGWFRRRPISDAPQLSCPFCRARFVTSTNLVVSCPVCGSPLSVSKLVVEEA